MLAPTNFTLFSFFFQFLQICRQLVDVGIGEGIGFGKGGYKAAGAAAEQAEALENNLHVVSVEWTAEEAEIAAPAMNLRLVARGISASGVFPASSIREVG